MSSSRPRYPALVTLMVCLLGCPAALTAVGSNCWADDFVYTNPDADAYVLTQADISYSTNATPQDVDHLNARFSGDFLWMRRAGNEVVISDHRIIDEAIRLFRPMNPLESEQREIRTAQEQLASDRSELEKERDILDQKVKDAGDSKRDELEQKRSELKFRQEALDARSMTIDSSQSAIVDRRNALEHQIQSELWSLIDRALLSGLGEDPGK